MEFNGMTLKEENIMELLNNLNTFNDNFRKTNNKTGKK